MTLRLITTGGTIASRLDPDTGAAVAVDGPEELVAAVPGLDDFGPIEVDEVARVNSWNLTPDHMAQVARRARTALLEDGVDGVVVTHGTDTVEETAYLTDLLAGAATERGGIVFTCAMRHAAELGADGPRNLLDAARTATHPDARGRGALLVVNGEVHAARWVTKTATTYLSTFASPDRGPVGRLMGDAPRFDLPTPPRPPVGALAAGAGIDPHVAVVTTATGQDDAVLRWWVDEQHVHGLVVEGTGAGNVPGTMAPGVAYALEQGVPVVLTSRVPRGATLGTYGGPGGGATLTELGVIHANGLPTAKARLALMVALGIDRDVETVRRWFAEV